MGREISEIPANQAKIAPFTNKSSKLREIHTKIHPQSSSLFSEPSTENSRKLERINQISRSSPTAPANYAKFAESAPISNLEVNPVHSRKTQRMTQILHLPHNTSANHAKFATFAHNRRDRLPFLTHFAHVLLHICRIYAHILHHCRLVLHAYDFAVEIVFYIKCICILPNTYSSYQLHPLIPITHQNQNSQCCRYARLQPVYCQLIVLTSNILSLAKSLIGIGTVWLTPRLSVSIFQRPPAFLASY